MVIQIVQPQLCMKSLPEEQVKAKSDFPKCFGVNTEGKDVFEAILSWSAPPSPAPSVFSSTLVRKKKVPLLKASSVLNKAAPSLATPSSNYTKSTKAPDLGFQCKSSSKLLPQQNRTSSSKHSPNKSST